MSITGNAIAGAAGGATAGLAGGPIAAAIGAGIGLFAGLTKGIVTNVSERRGIDAQNRVNLANNQFNMETERMNRAREDSAFKEKQRADLFNNAMNKRLLSIKQENEKREADRTRAQMRTASLTSMRDSAMSGVKKLDRTMGLIGGGRNG